MILAAELIQPVELLTAEALPKVAQRGAAAKEAAEPAIAGSKAEHAEPSPACDSTDIPLAARPIAHQPESVACNADWSRSD